MKQRLFPISILLLLAVSLFFTSCGNGHGASKVTGTVIDGNLTNANPGLQAFLDKVSLDNTTEALAKSEIDGNGNFKLEFPEGLDAGLYRLRVGAKRVMFPLNGGEGLIKFQGNLSNLNLYDFSLEGVEGSSEYISIMSRYYNKEVNKTQIKEFVENTKYPLAGVLAALRGLAGDGQYLDTHKATVARMKSEMPDNDYTKQYAKFVGQLEQSINARMANERIKVGQPAPDIKLPSPTGKTYALSELKGKVVLIDFWASWCGPCRRANPHVVQAYKKFNNKGFEVFSVSLDGLDSRTKARFPTESQVKQQMERSKDRWVKAIEKDGLEWDYHVSDLKKWESAPASVYGVRGIPRTFLVDRDGKIAAINPSHYELEGILKDML